MSSLVTSPLLRNRDEYSEWLEESNLEHDDRFEVATMAHVRGWPPQFPCLVVCDCKSFERVYLPVAKIIEDWSNHTV